MQSKTLSFPKLEKTITRIDSVLNEVLKDTSFKFATQNQSYAKGKMVVTLFFDPKPGTVRAKAFKDQDHRRLDDQINEFISDKKIVFVTQTFIGSSIYSIVYYDIGKKTTEPTTPVEPTTPPTSTETTPA